jgi:hypothetical protein
MAQSPVAADNHQSFDVLGNFPPQITFHPVFFLNNGGNLPDFFFGQIFPPGIGIDPRSLENVPGKLAADSEDVGEGDLNPLVLGNINSNNSRHRLYLLYNFRDQKL